MKIMHILDPMILDHLNIRDDKTFIKLNKEYQTLRRRMDILGDKLSEYESTHRKSLGERFRNKTSEKLNKLKNGVHITLDDCFNGKLENILKGNHTGGFEQLSKNSGFIGIEILRNAQSDIEIIEYKAYMGDSDITKHYTDEEVNKIVDSYLNNIKSDINGKYHDGRDKWEPDGFSFDKAEGTFTLRFVRSAK